jgi:hypothetical protein
MRAKSLVLAAAILAFGGILSASTLVNCAQAMAAPGTYGLNGLAGTAQVLDSNGTWSCEQGNIDYTFTPTSYYNFTNVPTTAVAVSFVNSLSYNFEELQFSVSGQNAWDTANGGFTISFTAALCTNVAICGTVAAPLTSITSADTQETPPNALAVMTTSLNGNNATLGGAGNTNKYTVNLNTNTVTFLDTYTPGPSDVDGVTGVTNDAYETVGPEPSTMMLMGGALIGLGVVARKRRKS